MLSIIVPVRNESHNLNELLEYFSKNLAQLDYEILIVNDFSDDDTFKKAESLFFEYKQFKILNNQKKGLGGAINLGVKKAIGENVAIMMADQSDDINDLIKYKI